MMNEQVIYCVINLKPRTSTVFRRTVMQWYKGKMEYRISAKVENVEIFI